MNAATTTLMQSKNGTVHVVAWSYVSQTGHIVYMNRCNKGYIGAVLDSGAITCKLCAKRS